MTIQCTCAYQTMLLKLQTLYRISDCFQNRMYGIFQFQLRSECSGAHYDLGRKASTRQLEAFPPRRSPSDRLGWITVRKPDYDVCGRKVNRSVIPTRFRPTLGVFLPEPHRNPLWTAFPPSVSNSLSALAFLTWKGCRKVTFGSPASATNHRPRGYLGYPPVKPCTVCQGVPATGCRDLNIPFPDRSLC